MSYRELLDRLLAHKPWIEEQGIPTGSASRFADLCNAVEFVDEAYRTGVLAEMMDGRTNPEAMWGLVEATELEACLAGLRPLETSGLADVVRKALIGGRTTARIPVTPEGEGESAVTRARNAAFELAMGAHLSQLDGSVSFVEPDVLAPFGIYRLLSACKRPFSAKGLLERAEEGAQQISRSRRGPNDIGILAVAADRIVGTSPGRLYLESPTETEAKGYLDNAIATGPLLGIQTRLDAIGDRAVDVVIVLASVPGVVGGTGLNRLSRAVFLLRSTPPGLDPTELGRRLTECFASP